MFLKMVRLHGRFKRRLSSGKTICDVRSVLIALLLLWAAGASVWAYGKSGELSRLAEEQKHMRSTIIRQNEILAINTAVVKGLFEVTKKYEMSKSIKDELKLKEIKL